MDYAFSKDQDMIRETVRKFLENECPREKIRELLDDDKGYDPEMWQKMVELGWMGFVLPEEYDGTGGEYLDLLVIMEEIGRNILPSPFFSTVALCSLPVLKFGTDEQKSKILPKIAAEGEIWTLAITESSANNEGSDIKLSANLEGSDYILNGSKMFVSYAHVADQMLVVARSGNGGNPEDGISFFIIDAKSPGISVNIIPTTARDKRCEVIFNNVKVPKDNILGEKDKGSDIIDYIYENATVLKCAEMSGGATAALDLTTQYSKERVQFEKPIGSFQAIQHRLVNMLIEVEGLRYLVYEAAWQINSGSPSMLHISMAKTKANKVYQSVCMDAMVTHGAIGFTNEMDVGLYHMRSKSLEFELGATDFHRERIASEIEKHEPAFKTLWG